MTKLFLSLLSDACWIKVFLKIALSPNFWMVVCVCVSVFDHECFYVSVLLFCDAWCLWFDILAYCVPLIWSHLHPKTAGMRGGQKPCRSAVAWSLPSCIAHSRRLLGSKNNNKNVCLCAYFCVHAVFSSEAWKRHDRIRGGRSTQLYYLSKCTDTHC